MSTNTILPAFDPHDPAGIDDLLTDDERAVRHSVRRLCEGLEPHVAGWFEAVSYTHLRAHETSLSRMPSSA